MGSKEQTPRTTQNLSDDEIPDIDHGDPIHEFKRQPSCVRESRPSYDVLIEDVNELNQSLFDALKKTNGETNDDDGNNELVKDKEVDDGDLDEGDTNDGNNDTGENEVVHDKGHEGVGDTEKKKESGVETESNTLELQGETLDGKAMTEERNGTNREINDIDGLGTVSDVLEETGDVTGTADDKKSDLSSKESGDDVKIKNSGLENRKPRRKTKR